MADRTTAVRNSTGRLKRVLLGKPTYHRNIPVSDVARDLDDAGIERDHETKVKQHQELEDVFRQLSIDISWVTLEPEKMPWQMFTRDFGVNTPQGVLVGRFRYQERKGEEIAAKRSLEDLGETLLPKQITRGAAEGGDLFWLDQETLVIGNGNRSTYAGYEQAKEITDFCFIANPYYPTPEMLQDLQAHLPNLIKSYPSSNPETSQQHLAAVLHVNPEHLIIGNGATELIVLINTTLIDRIGVPIPTFGEYIEKLKDQRDAEVYPLDPERHYELRLSDYLVWLRRRNLRSLLVINPGNPTGQSIPLEEMMDFMHQARDFELVIVDESFIDFAGDPIPSLLPAASRFSNLLIVRSMSKHCGVPGLRLGYCYSDNLYLLNRLRRFIPTWNLNTLAQYFLSQLPATDAA